DLVAPSAFQGGTPGPTNQYSGIRLEGSGNLSIATGGDFIGGIVNGQKVGPGFVLSDGKATVDSGGNIGSSESYANLTVGTRMVDGATGATRLGLATVDLIAQKNIYL